MTKQYQHCNERCTLMYQLPIKAPAPWVIASFRAALRPPLQESQEVKSCAEVLLGITCNGPKTIPHIAVILIVGKGDNARKKRLALKISRKVKPHFIGKRYGNNENFFLKKWDAQTYLTHSCSRGHFLSFQVGNQCWIHLRWRFGCGRHGESNNVTLEARPCRYSTYLFNHFLVRTEDTRGNQVYTIIVWGLEAPNPDFQQILTRSKF